MFGLFKKKYKYARLINNEERGFVLITSDDEEEIGKMNLEKAMNKVGEKGYEFIQHDENLGLIFKKVV